MHTRVPRSLLAATLVLSTIVAVGGPASPPAAAAGTPDISLTATTRPTEALLGEEIEVELTIRNTTGDNGFNTTIRDVLPPDVEYVAGSATPDPAQFPQPDGSTVLVWENLFDSLAGTTEVFTYRMLPDDDVYDVFAPNNEVSNGAEAYTNSDPRIVPRPDAAGTVTNFTGNDTASATTTLIPFRIVKTEPSEESELLRGVHDHQTVFTLRVENNFRGPSENFSVVDYLPAGMEFLGCGTADNSTPGTEEYDGSGRIPNFGSTLDRCAPTSVTTVEEDPPGSLPFGVYTRAEWTGLGDLAAGAVIEIEYAAAIPLQENTFPGPANPTSNLDNNTGPLTTETPGEFGLVNEAAATGDFTSVIDPLQSDTFTDTDTETVIVEDISIHKRSNTQTFVQGQNVVYTLFIETSEYATRADDVVVTDILPPILDFNSATPTQATGPVDSGGGTLTLTWNVTDLTERSDTSTITIDTTVRDTYRDSGTPGIPVSSRDAATNTTSLTGDVTVTNGFDSVGPADGLGDESEHTITSGGPSITKQVSEQQPTLDCDEAGIVYTDGPEGDYRPGDHVCFLLTVDFPLDLDTIQPEVFDVLPDGFSLDTAAFGGDGWQLGPAHNAGTPTFEDLSPILRWQLPDVDALGNIFQVVIQATIDDPDVVSDADITANLMKFRYLNTAGDVFQERDEADVVIAEPVLGLDKVVIAVDGTAISPPADGVQVEEGDVVTYQVAVSNATGENTFDVSVRDVLPGPTNTPPSPIQITCADVILTSISSGGECDPANNWIQWETDDGIDVAAGATVDLTYDVTVPTGVSAGATLTNVAGVRRYEGDSNSGNPFTYVPANNIDDTLTPNTDRADDPSSITTATPSISKGRSTSINSGADGNSNGEATVGETITYTVTLDLPAGVTYFDAVVTDDLDAPDPGQLDLDAGSVTATLDVGAGADPLPAGVVLNVDDANDTWTVTFPADYPIPAGPDQQLVVMFDAIVLDVAANVRDHNTRNRVDFDYADGFGNDRRQRATVGTRIVEPNIELAKDENDPDDSVVGGDLLEYTLTVTNPDVAGRTSTGYDSVVVDTVPAELIVLEAPGDPAEDGDTIAPDGGIWDEGRRTITWTGLDVQPGDSRQLRYQAQVSPQVIAGTEITNDATVETTSMPGDATGERTATSPNAGTNYADDATDTVTVPGYSLTKQGDPGTATIGEQIDYTIVVTIPAGAFAYDVTVIDDVPAGVTFESLTSVACAQGGGACAPDITSAVVAPPSGFTPGADVAFFLGDLLPGATAERTVTIEYTAVIADVPAADAPSTQTNGARVHWNTTDEITTPPTTVPTPGDFDRSSPEVDDDVDTVEPTLEIDKNVVGQVGDTDTRRAVPGETLIYDLSITNTGTSPAHDLTISDVATDDAWAFADISGARPGLVNTDSDPVGGLEWTFDGPLDPGATLLITYTLTVPPGYDSSDENPTGPEQTNVADVPSYFGVPEAERTTNPDRVYREYDDVTPDEVTIELDLASIGDRVWFDVDGDGVQDPGEPGVAGVDVLVTYLGPDGILGTADDETFPTTTDAAGNYLAGDLPGGDYAVDVTTDLTGQGLEPSFDLDGGTVSPNGAWTGPLGEDEDKLDIDFGYTGTGSVGDLIWLDQNLDGVQNLGEDGLGGVDVTVTWLGPDDLPGGGDDIDYPTTTDVDGNYLVEHLPFGEFSVTVDTTDLPADYDNVTDPDGGGDSTARTSLDAGTPDRLDQDFGYAGTGSIGDTIYLDRDGDGTQDPGEPGIANAVVELVHWGPDGAPGGGDDSFFSATTDATGNYLFENLPGGEYVVTVTGGITLVDNTGDPDGPAPIGDSTSRVTLPAGGDDLDQDFGYFADAVLGDTVWLDLDGDGVVDPGEPGLAGVEITITSPQIPGGLTTTTDGNGDYIFDAILPNDTYTVVVSQATLPPGVTQTHDFDDPADPTPTTPGQSVTSLADTDLEQDFGYRGAGVIGDTVWLDLDGDGTVDGGETGLEGVTMTLEWAQPGGPPITFTTTTDAGGNYRFEDLPDGDYTVTVDATTLPAGLSPTVDGDDPATGPGAGTPNTSAVSLNDVDGRTNLDQDFGYNGGGSIGDTVWFDRDRDGVLDTGESGIGGVAVELVWQSPTGPQIFTTTTGADGTYLFDNLPPGDYRVTVDTATLPTGMSATFDADGGLDDTSALTLGDGEDDVDQDFGYAGTGSIGDTIFLDLDGDGTQGTGEPGIPDQTVQLTTTLNGVDVTSTTTTDANGNYTFDNLPPGDYAVTVVGGIVDVATNTADPGDPPGSGDSTNTIALGDGENNDVQDFGYRGGNSIGDTIWYDVDADGTDDGAATEPRLAGVTVDIVWFGLDGSAGGGDDVALPTASSDAAGIYGVSGLPDGSYSVTVTGGLPTGLDTNTADPDGGGDGTSTVTDLGVGTTDPVADLDQDFGYSGSGSIGDRIWLDLDGDGVQDPGEPGIPAAVVTLTWAGPDGTFGTADDLVYPNRSTDSNGNYRFDDLPAGGFQTDVAGAPAGLFPTADPDGGGDDTARVTLAVGATDLDQDFGYVGQVLPGQSTGVGDTIWLDVDGDGVQDPGEPGVPDVTVTITSAGADGVLGTADDIVVTTETDADGQYLVVGLPSGPTRVAYDRADLPAGYVPNSDLDGGSLVETTVDLVAGEIRLDVDFGVVGDATITGTVWEDTNDNGIIDSGERGIPGVEVDVTWAGPDGPVTTTVTTDADGNWSITDIPPGDWTTQVDVDTVPDGYVPTTPTDGSVTIPPGGTGDVDNGFVPAGSIGDTVWIDPNRNGVRDAGEAGASGAVVILLDENRGEVARTTTDGNGNYVFDDLPPGTYTVQIDIGTLPPGLIVTIDTADPIVNGESTVPLGAGQDRTDVDFGLGAPQIPATGAETTGIVVAATSLILLGAALLLGRRRRPAM